LKFEWDEAKNRSNIRKHGFDLADAEEMLAGILFARPDTREDRWVGIRMIRGCVAVVAFAERDPDTIRIISLRKASQNERRQYAKAIENELETR